MSTRGSALTLGVFVALISGVTLGNGGADVMPVFLDDFAARFHLSDSSAGLVAATQLMATAITTLLLAARAARPNRVRMVRAGLALAGLGFLGATAAFDPVTLIVANLVIGAGLGVVYAAATAALAATDDADKASAVTITGTVCVTALLIVAVSEANHSLREGTGFLLMALCCAAAWPLVRHLPDGPTAPAVQDTPLVRRLPDGPAVSDVHNTPPMCHLPDGPAAPAVQDTPPMRHLPDGPAASAVQDTPLVCRLPDGPAAPAVQDTPPMRHLPDGPAAPALQNTPPVPTARPALLLLGGTALLWAVTQGAWSYASVLGREHTGMSHSAVSAVLAVSSVGALGGAAAGPAVAHRFGRMRSMAAFVVVQAAAMAVLIVTHDAVLFIVAALLWQTCQLAVLVQALAAAALLDASGRLVASLTGAGALGTGIGPLAVGAVLDGAGVAVLAFLLAAGTFAASLPLLRMTVASAKAAEEREAVNSLS